MTDDEIVKAFLDDASRLPLLTRDEERVLGQRICDGDKAARDELVQRNLRLVAMVAMRSPVSAGLSRADLIQEGTFGLMRAAEKFDWRKGFKFSTYATPWIQQAIGRAIAQHGRCIRVPQHTFDQVGQLRRAREELEVRHGRPASYEELAAFLRIPPERVAFLDDAAQEIVSLQRTLIGSDSLTMEDVLSVDPFDEIDLTLSLELEEALAHLSAREREAITARYGLDGAHARTWQELGDELGIEKASARTLERRGMEKLRAALQG